MANDNQTVTIQKTAKKYKRRHMELLLLLAIFTIMFFKCEDGSGEKLFGLVAALGTLAWIIINKILAWYNHG